MLCGVPELPDVEGFRRYLARHAEGREIVRVEIPDPELIRNRAPGTFRRALKGSRFATPRRHGKWLIAPAGGSELLLHFGMTGWLRWGADREDRDRHHRLIFVCEGGELRYNNMRRFGGAWLARDGSEPGAGSTTRCTRPSANRFATGGSPTARGGSRACATCAMRRARAAARRCAARRSRGARRCGARASSAGSPATETASYVPGRVSPPPRERRIRYRITVEHAVESTIPGIP